MSDCTGGEESFKKNLYARLGVAYSAVFDPRHFLSEDTLRVYELIGRDSRPGAAGPWPTIGLGLRLWQGKFEGFEDTWLRWCGAKGEIVPTGEERAAALAERIRELEAEVDRLKGEPPAEKR